MMNILGLAMIFVFYISLSHDEVNNMIFWEISFENVETH